MRFGTHVDNGLMQCVYQNQAATAYLSLHFFIFVSLQFSNKRFCRFLSGTARPTTHVDNGYMT